MNKKIFKNNYLYIANIHNWNFPDSKERPVVILKQRADKVLALQCTTKLPIDDFSKDVQESTNGIIKGFYISSTHWIEKESIQYEMKSKGKHIKIPSNIIFQAKDMIIKENKKKILKIKKKIKYNLNLYLKTKDKSHLIRSEKQLARWQHFDLNKKAPKNIEILIEEL